jgi:hypothetical protein
MACVISAESVSRVARHISIPSSGKLQPLLIKEIQLRKAGNFGIALKSSRSCCTTSRAFVLEMIFAMRSIEAMVSARL